MVGKATAQMVPLDLRVIAQRTRYGVIYADPAWQYTDKAAAGQRGACFKYATLPVHAIKALPVQEVTANDCACFLWATSPFLREALDVLDAWGFTYKTVAFVWVKTTRHGKLFMGMGNWTRANAEVCLLGVKGKPRRVHCGVRQVLLSPRREHSRKPDEVRTYIRALLGDVPAIELFGRHVVPGWDVWGDAPNVILAQTHKVLATRHAACVC